jgi:hypothetical protein
MRDWRGIRHPRPHPRRSGYRSQVLFSDGFETADYTAWSATAGGTNTAVTDTLAHSGTYSSRSYYVIAAGGDASKDVNRWQCKVLTSPINRFFFRGHLYLKTPEVGLDSEIVQRKLLWWSDSTVAGTTQVDYSNYLTSFTGTGGASTPTLLYLCFGGNPVNPAAGSITVKYDIATLTWDTWYSLGVDVTLNTSGNSDGILKVWIDESVVYTNSAVNFRGTCGDVSWFAPGFQTNRTHSEAIEEYRYWDDVVISNVYQAP